MCSRCFDNLILLNFLLIFYVVFFRCNHGYDLLVANGTQTTEQFQNYQKDRELSDPTIDVKENDSNTNED